jgi:hypothetical protein
MKSEKAESSAGGSNLSGSDSEYGEEDANEKELDFEISRECCLRQINENNQLKHYSVSIWNIA